MDVDLDLGDGGRMGIRDCGRLVEMEMELRKRIFYDGKK